MRRRHACLLVVFLMLASIVLPTSAAPTNTQTPNLALAQDCSGPVTSLECGDDEPSFPGAVEEPTVPPDCDGPVTDFGCDDGISDAATVNDRDGDGLSDDDEAWIGTDPDNPDTDGDGLDDYTEYNAGAEYGNWATNYDSDGDGLSDGEEAQLGTDFLNPDTDGDKAGDGVEVQEGKNPLDPTDNQTPEPPTEEPMPVPSPTPDPDAAAASTSCLKILGLLTFCVPMLP